jgi:hypothetical protein
MFIPVIPPLEKPLLSLSLSTSGLATRLGDTIRGVGLATAISDTEGSIIDSGVVSSTAVWVTNTISIHFVEHGKEGDKPRAAAGAVEVRADVVREAVLRVSVA